MVRIPDTGRLAETLTGRFGIRFSVTSHIVDGYPVLIIRPDDLQSPHGFSISVAAHWKRLEVRWVPDSFAGHLVRDMGRVAAEKYPVFRAFADSLRRDGARLSFRINDRHQDLEAAALPEEAWMAFELAMTRIGVDLTDTQNGEADFFDWCQRFVGMIVAFLPVEEPPDEDLHAVQGLPEGAKIQVELNRYERSALNRRACIAIRGNTCHGCGFNFGQVYGELGEGFIHVHHKDPVSVIGPGYIINPARDLVPLCPNCHVMVHRVDPPMPVEKLREITGFVLPANLA